MEEAEIYVTYQWDCPYCGIIHDIDSNDGGIETCDECSKEVETWS